MKEIHNIQFTPDGQAVFEKIMGIWPPILQQRKQDQILTMLRMLMASRRVKVADQTLVIEATRYVVPKSYDPFFHMIQDMKKFKRRILDTFSDIKAYNARPVRVHRWKHPPAPKKKRTCATNPRVVAFCASPRKHGNTDMLIDKALEGCRVHGAQTEKIYLHDIDMGFCIGCRRCKEPKAEQICVVKDDMQKVYQKIIDAQAIIIGFPIYTGREAAQLSTFLDRWDGFERYMFKSALQPGRVAMVIGTWGYPYPDTYDHVIESIITILSLHKIETVEALSACGFEGMLHGLDENHRGVIAHYPRELQKAFDAGYALVRAIP
ncbi:MAG: flavodoxin family protein [Desulfobacterota bacterium]|nr:flavodoxin family protein [Thermodesulfobacteriota bacterium]